MGKGKRSIESNRKISISVIIILVISIILVMFSLIFVLYSNSIDIKRNEETAREIEAIKIEISSLNEEIEKASQSLGSVVDSTNLEYILKDNYRYQLTEFENYVIDSTTDEKIAYFVFDVDNNTYLDSILDTLYENEILSTFFIDNKEDGETIKKYGHLLGLYLNDYTVKENENDSNYINDLSSTFEMELYMQNVTSEENLPKIKLTKVTENSTSEGKAQLTKDAYIKNILETAVDREFLIIKLNVSNSNANGALEGIISGLKEKGYIFLPLINTSQALN